MITRQVDLRATYGGNAPGIPIFVPGYAPSSLFSLKGDKDMDRINFISSYIEFAKELEDCVCKGLLTPEQADRRWEKDLGDRRPVLKIHILPNGRRLKFYWPSKEAYDESEHVREVKIKHV